MCEKVLYFVKVHATNVINFEKNRMLLLTRKELKLHQDATVQYICGKRFLQKFAKDKNYRKVRNHCHYTGKYRSTRHIYPIKNIVCPTKLHNESNYYDHFIIKELANEFEIHFECHGENTEKYKTFSVSIEKIT